MICANLIFIKLHLIETQSTAVSEARDVNIDRLPRLAAIRSRWHKARHVFVFRASAFQLPNPRSSGLCLSSIAWRHLANLKSKKNTLQVGRFAVTFHQHLLRASKFWAAAFCQIIDERWSCMNDMEDPPRNRVGRNGELGKAERKKVGLVENNLSQPQPAIDTKVLLHTHSQEVRF